MYIPRFNKMAKGKCNTPSITRRKFLSHSSQKMTYAKRGFLKQKEFSKNEECFKGDLSFTYNLHLVLNLILEKAVFKAKG